MLPSLSRPQVLESFPCLLLDFASVLLLFPHYIPAESDNAGFSKLQRQGDLLSSPDVIAKVRSCLPSHQAKKAGVGTLFSR